MAMLEGHAAVVHRGALFIFGGRDVVTGMLRNTVWRLPLPDVAAAAAAASSATAGGELCVAAARVVPCSGHVPPPRCYAAVAQRGAFLLVAGGATLDDDDDTRRYPPPRAAAGGRRPELSGDLPLFALNLDTAVWSLYYIPPAVPGPTVGGGAAAAAAGPDVVPAGRCHASLSCAADGVALFGGFPAAAGAAAGPALPAGLGGVFHVGDGGTVRRLPCDGDAPRLWGHSAVFTHGCLFVFGGVDTAASAEVNTLCVFGSQERRWRWADFAVAPEPRALHTAVMDGSQMVVFGGFSGAGGRQAFPHLGDTWVFSLNTGTWQELCTAGDVPLPRSGHAAAIHDGQMYVVGGLEGNAAVLPSRGTVAVLDVARRRWATAPLHLEADAVPPPRALPAAPDAADAAPPPDPRLGPAAWDGAAPGPATSHCPAAAPEAARAPPATTTVSEWRARQHLGPGAGPDGAHAAAPGPGAGLDVPPAPRRVTAAGGGADRDKDRERERDVHVESVLSLVRHVREAEHSAAARRHEEAATASEWRSRQLAEAAAHAELHTAELSLAARGLSTASALQEAMEEQRRRLSAAAAPPAPPPPPAAPPPPSPPRAAAARRPPLLPAAPQDVGRPAAAWPPPLSPLGPASFGPPSPGPRRHVPVTARPTSFTPSAPAAPPTAPSPAGPRMEPGAAADDSAASYKAYVRRMQLTQGQ